MATKRLCGIRVEGGIYMECGLSPFGQPLEHFLLDPPLKFDKDKLGISPIGVTTFERNGVVHVADWVGEQFYPGPASFLDEVRKMGLSRRIPKTFDFSLLTRESRIYIAHPKGYVANCDDLYQQLSQPPTCPKQKHEFETQYIPDYGSEFVVVAPDEYCAGMHWLMDEQLSKDARFVPGFIAVFPITNLAVIKGNGFEEAMKAASEAGVPVYEEES